MFICERKTSAKLNYSMTIKHTTTLFYLSDYYIQSREWRVIVDQVHINIMVGLYGIIMLLISQVIMRDPHYGRMCFKLVKHSEFSIRVKTAKYV